MPPVSRLLAVLGLSAVLAGCGSGTEDTDNPAAPGKYQPTPTATASGSESPSAATQGNVPAILTFKADKVGGGSFDGAALAGKDTVFWFWAPWCAVCARSADDVKVAADELSNVTLVGVAGLSSDAGAMEDFVERHDVGAFTQLADTGGDLYTRFGVKQQHTFVLVGADGKVTNHPAYGKDVDLAALVRATFG